MSDKSVGMDYSIGHVRIKYLDLANLSFAQGNYSQCKGYIDSFMDTIKEDSGSGKELKAEFDRVYLHRSNLEKQLELEVGKLGWLERKDFEDQAKSEVSVNTIHDIKEICWRISLKDGLFFE